MVRTAKVAWTKWDPDEPLPKTLHLRSCMTWTLTPSPTTPIPIPEPQLKGSPLGYKVALPKEVKKTPIRPWPVWSSGLEHRPVN